MEMAKGEHGHALRRMGTVGDISEARSNLPKVTDLAFKAVRYYKKWSRRFRTDFVRHHGLTLPARHLRLCGAEFHDDAYFLESARYETERLISRFGLNRESRVLDVGCGMGRLPLGILSRLGEIRCYRGIDVQADCIGWCVRHIQKEHPEFQFIHVNARNARYNPDGSEVLEGFRFPFDSASFDIINMFSVFTHLTEDTIRIYLEEFRRVLAPEGKVFLTAYVEDEVADMSENPPGYLLRSVGPLHVVRYNRAYFQNILAEFGWKVDGFEHAKEPPGQSVYYLSRM
jgi:SAM-dependent methyltransferase